MEDRPLLQYQKLIPEDREIRTFELLLHGDDDLVCGKLCKSRVGGGYIALSYCWGPPANRRMIVVDDCKLFIPRNLEVCLREIYKKRCNTRRRFSNLRLPIWADAISINQDDLEERASQVSMMRLIYSRAVEVVAWVGIQSDDSNDVMEYIQRLPIEWKTPSEPVLRDGAVLDPSMAQRLLCITQRPYWKRAWIIQELVTARTNDHLGSVTVHCGQKQFGLFKLALLARVSTTPLFSYAPQVKSILSLRTAYQKEACIAFLEILYETRHAQATDPRDKVFAILGLTSDGDDYVQTIDYRKSVEELTIDVTRFAITKQASLNIICLKPLHEPGFQGLPSWTPPWFHFHDPYLLRMVNALTERTLLNGHLDMPLDELHVFAPVLFDTSSPVEFHSENRSILSTEGRYATHITELSQAVFKEGFSWETMAARTSNSAQKGWKFCKFGHGVRVPPFAKADPDHMALCRLGHAVQAENHLSPYPEAGLDSLMTSIFSLDDSNNPHKVPFSAVFSSEGADVLTRHFSALNEWLQSLKTFDFSFHGKTFEEWIDASPVIQREWAVWREKHSPETLKSWLRPLLTTLQNRVALGMRLVVTANGMMGWVHANTQLHDCIYILPGCRFPVVLRPEDPEAGDDGIFRVVGDAWFAWPESVVEELKERDLVTVRLC